MPRYSKVTYPEMFHHRETYFKDSVNKSLTTEHCYFFLKKYGSEKVFQQYLSKYYPRNSGCSYHKENSSKSIFFPQLVHSKSKYKDDRAKTYAQKPNQRRLKSLHEPKYRSPVRYQNGGCVYNYELKLNGIIKKIKSYYRKTQPLKLN